jgi:hypothetical protein
MASVAIEQSNPMTKLWFKARSFGWGWTPVSVEGWVVVVVFLVLVLAGTAIFMYQIRGGADQGLATVLYLAWVALLVGALVAIGYATGEPPRWRWGA